MKTIKTELEGIAPILFNRFTEEAQGAMERGSSGKPRTVEQRIEEAHNKVYRKNGFIGVPASAIKKSLLVGVQKAKIKFGRGSAEPYLRALLFPEEDFYSIHGAGTR